VVFVDVLGYEWFVLMMLVGVGLVLVVVLVVVVDEGWML